MKIFILADMWQQEELLSGKNRTNDILLSDTLPPISELIKNDAIFILNDSWRTLNIQKIEATPVFINCVTETLSDLNLPEHVSRINAWPGFLQRASWEIATKNFHAHADEAIALLGKKFLKVKDEPGLVAARVISMIINEAFFAIDDEVSTREEIDLAMKLGTNYPFGPFEWAKKIGIKNIYQLLQKLSEKDERYTPSPALRHTYTQNID